jgi:predicted nucleic acid-binding protein
MVLVDTSVWISYLRNGNVQLEELLNNGRVMCHPFIIGELACGRLKNRTEVLSLLRSLPVSTQASHLEFLQFIETHKLMGRGLGYVDVHLCASARLSGVPLWTLNKVLAETNKKLHLNYSVLPLLYP